MCPALVAAGTIGYVARLLAEASPGQPPQADDPGERLEVMAAAIVQALTACGEGKVYATRTCGLQVGPDTELPF